MIPALPVALIAYAIPGRVIGMHEQDYNSEWGVWDIMMACPLFAH